MKALIRWTCQLAIGIALYRWGKATAYAERGYEAVGAELMFLVLPFFVPWLWRYIVRPYIAWAKEIYKTDEEREIENVL